MSDSSYYVHSRAIVDGLGDGDFGLGPSDNNGASFTTYIDSAIEKLTKIADELDAYADKFLQGYTPPGAQDNAKLSDDALVQIARELIYGPQMSKFANQLVQKTSFDKEDLQRMLDQSGIEGKMRTQILKIINDTTGDTILVNELAKALTQKGGPVMTVSRSKAYFNRLGFLAGVSAFDWKGEEKEVSSIITKNLRSRKGYLLDYTKSILRASPAVTSEDVHFAAERFCNSFEREFRQEVKKRVKFVEGTPEELNRKIDAFLKKFREILPNELGNNTVYTQASGDLGEAVDAAITQAGNTTIVDIKIGEDSDEKGIKKATEQLAKRSIEAALTPLKTHHNQSKQSQTDLILANTNNGMVVRAQSKNMSADYFTKEEWKNSKGENVLAKNFRFHMQSSLELGNFITGLANTNMGVSLNAGELEGIIQVLVQALWLDSHDYITRDGQKINYNSGSSGGMIEHFRHNLEAYASGQVVNMLGVTVQKDMSNLTKEATVFSGSNVFYLLNGRLTKTSDLIRPVISQLEAYKANGYNIANDDRAVIVTINTSSVKWMEDKTNTFYITKLRYLSADDESGLQSYGEKQGRAAASSVKVEATLGGSITKFANSSFTF